MTSRLRRLVNESLEPAEVLASALGGTIGVASAGALLVCLFTLCPGLLDTLVH